jgi:hypothetical protein
MENNNNSPRDRQEAPDTVIDVQLPIALNVARLTPYTYADHVGHALLGARSRIRLLVRLGGPALLGAIMGFVFFGLFDSLGQFEGETEYDSSVRHLVDRSLSEFYYSDRTFWPRFRMLPGELGLVELVPGGVDDMYFAYEIECMNKSTKGNLNISKHELRVVFSRPKILHMFVKSLRFKTEQGWGAQYNIVNPRNGKEIMEGLTLLERSFVEKVLNYKSAGYYYATNYSCVGKDEINFLNDTMSAMKALDLFDMDDSELDYAREMRGFRSLLLGIEKRLRVAKTQLSMFEEDAKQERAELRSKLQGGMLTFARKLNPKEDEVLDGLLGKVNHFEGKCEDYNEELTRLNEQWDRYSEEKARKHKEDIATIEKALTNEVSALRASIQRGELLLLSLKQAMLEAETIEKSLFETKIADVKTKSAKEANRLYECCSMLTLCEVGRMPKNWERTPPQDGQTRCPRCGAIMGEGGMPDALCHACSNADRDSAGGAGGAGGHLEL